VETINQPKSNKEFVPSLPPIRTRIEGNDSEEVQKKLRDFKSALIRMRNKDISISNRAFNDGIELFEEGVYTDILSMSRRGTRKQRITDFLNSVKLIKNQVEIEVIKSNEESGNIKFTYLKVVVP
jgi:hypothetical protein